MEKRRRHLTFAAVAGMALVISLTYHLVIEPGTDKMKTVKRPFAEQARTMIGRNEKVVYLGDFNTELIYFMDRDDYHFVWQQETDDFTAEDYAKRISASDRWIIAPPCTVKKLHAAAPGQWRERLCTIPNHQYPVILLERSGPEDK